MSPSKADEAAAQGHINAQMQDIDTVPKWAHVWLQGANQVSVAAA